MTEDVAWGPSRRGRSFWRFLSNDGPERPQDATIPRTIWMLWLQGLQEAPPVVAASLASWQSMNPGYTLRMLQKSTLSAVLPPKTLNRIFAKPRPPDVVSDEIRLELLARHGGIWADATTLCLRPLETWLAAHSPQGFFAFDKPAPDRMLSNWFLASSKQNLIVEQWRQAVIRYWRDRSARTDYFWCHGVFARCYASNSAFRAAWDATPRISAAHPLHFNPTSKSLHEPITAKLLAALKDPPAPVIKLTHKLVSWPGPESMMSKVLEYSAQNWLTL